MTHESLTKEMFEDAVMQIYKNRTPEHYWVGNICCNKCDKSLRVDADNIWVVFGICPYCGSRDVSVKIIDIFGNDK